MKRTSIAIKLGTWWCPSGNSVDVFFEADANGVGHLFCEWDYPPPLSPEDHAYYLAVVLPKVRLLASGGRESHP